MHTIDFSRESAKSLGYIFIIFITLLYILFKTYFIMALYIYCLFMNFRSAPYFTRVQMQGLTEVTVKTCDSSLVVVVIRSTLGIYKFLLPFAYLAHHLLGWERGMSCHLYKLDVMRP